MARFGLFTASGLLLVAAVRLHAWDHVARAVALLGLAAVCAREGVTKVRGCAHSDESDRLDAPCRPGRDRACLGDARRPVAQPVCNVEQAVESSGSVRPRERLGVVVSQHVPPVTVVRGPHHSQDRELLITRWHALVDVWEMRGH